VGEEKYLEEGEPGLRFYELDLDEGLKKAFMIAPFINYI